MKKNEGEIDFVIPWVDGSDPCWIQEFNKFCPEEKRIHDVSVIRYRDYGLLRYWFRGVEKFAPWVRKIHFITCGQKPDWLNLEASKLHWVKHEDYIPHEYLPVFSANPIELLMYKIPDLADRFVYFNDDFFLTSPVSKKFFFNRGLPCDAAIMNALSVHGIGHMVLNDLQVINNKFNKNCVLKRHPFKFFNPSYGLMQLRTICLLPWPKFTGFVDFHFANSFLKSTLQEVWSNYEEELTNTVKNKFRSYADINQWVFRYWQLCSGDFSPCNMKRGRKYFSIDSDVSEIVNSISKGKYKEIVLNDAECTDFDKRMEEIKKAFDRLLPNKSSFEV